MSAHGRRSRSSLFYRDGVNRERACRRKRAYTKAGAHQAAADRTEETGELLQAYECPFCPSWHIGHPRKPRKRARKDDSMDTAPKVAVRIYSSREAALGAERDARRQINAILAQFGVIGAIVVIGMAHRSENEDEDEHAVEVGITATGSVSHVRKMAERVMHPDIKGPWDAEGSVS